MSDEWEIPRASNGQRLRRGDSAVLSEAPIPLARQSTADLKATILADAGPVWPAARKLVQVEHWQRAHPGEQPKRAAVDARAMDLTGICFRGRLSAGNAALAYAAAVDALSDPERRTEERDWWRARWRSAEPFDFDPTDPVALWRAILPCPHALAAIAHMMMGWSPWWDWKFGRDPPACRHACTVRGTVALPCLDAGPSVHLTPPAAHADTGVTD